MADRFQVVGSAAAKLDPKLKDLPEVANSHKPIKKPHPITGAETEIPQEGDMVFDFLDKQNPTYVCELGNLGGDNTSVLVLLNSLAADIEALQP